MDVATGQTTDEIVGIPDWGEADWAADSSGLYYAGYGSEKLRTSGEPVGAGYRDMFHRLGLKQPADTVIYERPDEPTLLPFVRNTSDGHYLIATEGGVQRSILIRAVGDHGPFRVLRTYKNADYSYVGSSGYEQYFLTTDGAPRGKLVRIDLRKPSRSTDIIRETDLALDSVDVAGTRFVAHYLKDGRSDLQVYERTGSFVRHIPLPGVGTASFVPDGSSSKGYLTFTSITVRYDVYSYDVARNIRRQVLHTNQPFVASEFVTEELFAPSTGGARIPVFIAHRRGLHLDGHSRVLLTGYGGFGSSYNPGWQTLSALWLGRDGVFAIADVRGGGEYGDAWHRSGMLGEKQHVFDDFAAAARLLEGRGYGSPRTLGAYGYSGGGLLVGVTEVQHPELFGAVVEGAGPLDVLRGYTYGSEATWASEVGSPIASREQFDWLYGYAPLVAIKSGGHYPATLVMTSQNDARVSPAHAYKFAATLQWAEGSNPSVLLSVASDSGHVGNSTTSTADTMADVESFLWSHLSP
jgi:prolyl oligopeptidase